MDFKQHLKGLVNDEQAIEQAFLQECSEWAEKALNRAKRALENEARKGNITQIKKGFRKSRVVSTDIGWYRSGGGTPPPEPPKVLIGDYKQANKYNCYRCDTHPAIQSLKTLCAGEGISIIYRPLGDQASVHFTVNLD